MLAQVMNQRSDGEEQEATEEGRTPNFSMSSVSLPGLRPP